MKWYKNINDDIYAYENDVPEFGTPDAECTVAEGLIRISEEDALAIINKPLTPEQIVENNEFIKVELLAEANEKIAILQDVIDLDMQEANEEEQLKAWKKYRILLLRVDTDVIDVIWPKKPE
ncbi:tail fiber assembly protein [Orbaceae bacterium ESL0727]|nr:tail fiber assembly protein [Orbaceae bacterium ESL0727]MDF7667947.1 tail fiber assembly protein [Orbaceae bacterium ESL0727]